MYFPYPFGRCEIFLGADEDQNACVYLMLAWRKVLDRGKKDL
jgi:hypothetical protein